MRSKFWLMMLIPFLFFGCPQPDQGGGGGTENTPPAWVSGFPALGTISSTSVDIQVKVNEASTIYVVALATGATQPTCSQVKAGTDAVGSGVPKSTLAINANTPGIISIPGLNPSTAYDFYLVAMDAAALLQASPVLLNASTVSSDETPPTWASTYPQTANLGATSVDLKVKINETGKAYAWALDDGATAPTSAQVKAASIKAGNTSLTANTEGVLSISGLTASTAYDIYVTAEDGVPNLQSAPVKLDITTLTPDSTPPSWISTYPSTANVGNTSFDLKLQINESGMYYGILVASGATAPTAAQVKAGTNYGVTVIQAKTGSLTASTEAIISFTGLTASTTYDLYLVAEDPVPNLMASPSKLTVTTTSVADTTAPTWTSTYPQLTNITGTSFTLKVSQSESGKVYAVAVPKDAQAPTSAQVKAGTNYAAVTVAQGLNTTVTGSVEGALNFSGLADTAEYDIYVVGEDSVPNVMASPQKLTLLVTSTPTWTFDATSYTTNQKVGLASATGGAIITYTTDGSAPDGTADGTVEKTYSSAITAAGTLKAIAVKAGYKPSLVLNAGSFPKAVGYHNPPTGDYSALDSGSWSTATYSLGAKFVSGTSGDATFALYSAPGSKVVLEIYSTNFGEDAKWDYDMAKGSDNIWRAKVKNLPSKVFYAYRVWGPNFPYDTGWTRGSTVGIISFKDASANRFNPNKVVYDPYATELSHDDESLALKAAGLDGRVYASSTVTWSGGPAEMTGKTYQTIDTGKYAPKGILFKDTTSTGTKPAIPKADAMIYEAHVRALSKSDSTANLTTILSGMSEFTGIENVPVAERGTYLGAAKMAKYLKGLGFNTIELLPVHECFNNEMNDSVADTNLVMGQENFWGYMTANFFAPERRFASDQTPGGPTREFKQMVKAFHDAGIEVYLDVVYNHTGEGGTWDATGTAKITSFRGIDNSGYYQLVSTGDYQNDTGCGNNFAGANSAPARQLVIDSLTYWLDEMGVDGFRFDLAPVLGRDSWTAGTPASYWGWNSNATLLNQINTLGSNKNAEMIAEAWDASGSAYVLTQFPGNWSDWNGKFRDEIRSAVTGGSWGKIGDSMSGSTYYGYSAAFPESVNFVTAHDGLTLLDVVSYSAGGYASKQFTQNGSTFYGNDTNMNLGWPFGPSDGGDSNNHSSDFAGNNANRRQALRNFWTITYFSKGIPMSLYGDEFGRTQNGNNNTYNVDSPATWSNYNQINTDSPTAAAIPGTTATYHDNFGTDGHADSKNGLFLFVQNLLKIRASNSALRNMATPFSNWASADSWATTGSFTIDGGANGNFLILVNMSGSDKTFNIPGGAAAGWKRIIATGSWAENNVTYNAYDNFWSLASAWVCDQANYEVGAKEIVVFQK